jgi:hypothetical protein
MRLTDSSVTARVSRALGLFGSSVLVSACLLFSSQVALAQFSQQGLKLVGIGGEVFPLLEEAKGIPSR